MRIGKICMKSSIIFPLFFLFFFIFNSSAAIAGAVSPGIDTDRQARGTLTNFKLRLTSSADSLRKPAVILDNPYNKTGRRTNMFKILSALENKMEVQDLPEEEKSKLLGKAKNKLFVLDDSQIELLVSLSNRITTDSHSPAGDVAFLLVTALIVLS
jgi:hypothetical protein